MLNFLAIIEDDRAADGVRREFDDLRVAVEFVRVEEDEVTCVKVNCFPKVREDESCTGIFSFADDDHTRDPFREVTGVAVASGSKCFINCESSIHASRDDEVRGSTSDDFSLLEIPSGDILFKELRHLLNQWKKFSPFFGVTKVPSTCATIRKPNGSLKVPDNS